MPMWFHCYDNTQSCYNTVNSPIPWWCHQMETFSVLLALCAGNPPVNGEFPAQRPVTWSFDVFFDLCLNKPLHKESWGWWFEMPSRSLWRHRNAMEQNTYEGLRVRYRVSLWVQNMIFVLLQLFLYYMEYLALLELKFSNWGQKEQKLKIRLYTLFMLLTFDLGSWEADSGLYHYS